MNLDIVLRIARLEKRLDGLIKPERGWTPHFLTTPYTNTTFDGDSFSDTVGLVKIENTSWSTAIPANAKALIIYGYCRDSGSAATTGLVFALYSAAAATTPAVVMAPSGKANDDYAYCNGTVPATDGDIWYLVNASGASTMDVWLFCFGWWE